ncbi:phosphotransferase [Dankookia sp. P2]|uniref:phosphotransferase n=1 Tax=Dankookia sp. P2 TaxID=3423955 RepID=UPI003D678F37
MRYPDPFLAAHGYAAAERLPLAADASLRTYTRLLGGPRPALLMDAPPPEDVRPFAALARHFLAAGLSLPEIIAEDAGAGFLLLEDFGDATHAALLDAGTDPVPLYTEAAEALAALHAAPVPPACRPGTPRRWRARRRRPSSTGGGPPPSARPRRSPCGRVSTRPSTPCWRPSPAPMASSTATTSRPT